MPFLRKYNTAISASTAQSIKIPLIKRGVVDFAVGADWTPAAGDVKVSKDGGAAANIATLPAAVAMGNTAYWEFVFSGSELSCGTLKVTIADSATKAVEDQSFIVETFGNASALYQADLSAANLPANVTQLLGTAWLTPGTAGTPDVNAKLVGGQTASASGTITFPNATLASTTNITAAAGCAVSSIGTDVINSNALAASAVTEIWASVADSSGVTSLLSRLSSARAGYLDNLSAGAVAQASTFTGMTSLAQWLGAMAGKQTPNSTALTEINATGAGSGTYSAITDANEALRDRGDAAWATSGLTNNGIAAAVWDLAMSGHTTSGTFGAAMNAAGSAGDPWATTLPGAYGGGTAGALVGALTASGVRGFVGLGSANLDTQLNNIYTVAGLVQAKTDNLPASPAAVGSAMTLATDAVNSNAIAASGVTEIWASATDSPGVTTLLGRVTATRAGYWDNLSAGAVSTAAAVAALNNISTAQVLTQVNTALDTALTLPGQASPGSTPTLREAVAQLTQLAIRKTVTNKDTGIQTVYAANGTTEIQKRTIADDGSAFTLGPLISA